MMKSLTSNQLIQILLKINPADDGQAETVVVFPDNNDSTTETEPTPQSEPEDSNNGLQGQHFADTDDLN